MIFQSGGLKITYLFFFIFILHLGNVKLRELIFLKVMRIKYYYLLHTILWTYLTIFYANNIN